ncbi:mevalonate kinase [Eremomyces bilateralis CBS 781.70]|uniref:Mevalonate kinase n=1 Tax=Eremomyces bilateralis CBS 781.70 TaxID=1392243 RepID=A0A6G1GC51_9PEZI|nr:mevalonate kinase [Eremomyces bilateralis CBS 781.70]KAF1815678.1 mevalonate kinase [Eremomyces bilateralis CBS 781.70]
MAQGKATATFNIDGLTSSHHDDGRTRSPLGRKDSSPLMPPFMVSAPGKVIVYGEHAVVHGKAAIAASISLRSYLLVHFLSKSRRTVSLLFPDIGLSHTWDIPALPWSAFSAPGKKKTYYDLVTELDPDLLEALEPHIDNISPNAPPATRKIHQSSATAFLYLFLSLGTSSSPPCVYTLRSTIPIGAGLGSSASIAVCLSSSLLVQCRALAGPHPDQPAAESELNIERINRWAFVAEMCIHGNPSGVDNTVSSGGKAVLFQRRDYSKPPLVKRLNTFPELPLLLVNTRQSRSTATEVAKVANLRKSFPTIAESVLSAIDNITESAHTLLTSDDFDADSTTLKTLGELAAINHGLLVALGVSHPKLERLRALIDHTGIGWTKLTGAGGGGCAITILNPEWKGKPDGGVNGVKKPSPKARTLVRNGTDSEGSSEKRKSGLEPALIAPKALIPASLSNQLQEEGFEVFTTTLAGDGVGVLWPAVLHNVNSITNREEGGEEIDQEKFLTAVGTEGIEKLVGVSNTFEEGHPRHRGGVGGWKFWRY